jgi:hypothetical protein
MAWESGSRARASTDDGKAASKVRPAVLCVLPLCSALLDRLQLIPARPRASVGASSFACKVRSGRVPWYGFSR